MAYLKRHSTHASYAIYTAFSASLVSHETSRKAGISIFTGKCETYYLKVSKITRCALLCSGVIHIVTANIKSEFLTTEILGEAQLIDQAIVIHQEGNLELAAELYQKALEINPDSYDALNFLGLIDYQKGNWVESIEWFKQAIRIFPANPSFYLNIGNSLKQLGRVEDAKILYAEAIKLDPYLMDAYRSLAVLHHASNEFQLALDVLNSATEKLNESNQSILNLEQLISLIILKSSVQRQMNCPREALETLEEMRVIKFTEALETKKALDQEGQVPLDPRLLGDVYLNLGLTYEDLKELDKAIDSYTKAAQCGEHRTSALFNRGNAYQNLNRWDDALVDYDQVLLWDSEHVGAWLNRGLLLYKQTHFQDALDSLGRAISLDPENAVAYSNLGVVQFELGQMLDALFSFEKATQYDPNYVEAFSNKGNVLKELRQLDAALEAYDKAISLNSNYYEAFTNRGVVYFELERFGDALLDYERAIELNPLYASAHSNKGNVLKERGELDAALASISRAVELQFKLIKESALDRRVKPQKPMLVSLASKVLLELHALLELHEIPFFLAYGTLLGIYRDGEVLPHDKDLDVGLGWNCSREKLIQVLSGSGKYWIDPKSTQPGIAGEGGGVLDEVLNIGVIEKSSGISIDFFFFKPEGAHLLSGFHHLPYPLMWRFTPFELAPINYKGLQFNTPGDPQVYLTDIYGPNWRIPDPYFDSLVSGYNLDPRSRGVSMVYAYSRLFDQMTEQNWKKAYGYCKQLASYGESQLISSIERYLAPLVLERQ